VDESEEPEAVEPDWPAAESGDTEVDFVQATTPAVIAKTMESIIILRIKVMISSSCSCLIYNAYITPMFNRKFFD